MGAARTIVVLDAPSNLGLRPPEEGSVPGCYKAPGALRDRGLVERLGARDGGVVVPPRYRAEWWPGYGVRNGEAIARYSAELASRVGALVDEGGGPLVLGGDCSVLIGPALALRSRPGRFGLVFVDGHSDFRHVGNAPAVGAAAGEDLAIVTGRGGELSRLGGHSRYVEDADVFVAGLRPDDEYLDELRELGIETHLARDVRGRGAEVGAAAVAHMEERGTDGYWVHVDVDVLDASVMPAVDSPDPDGLEWTDLPDLLAPLLSSSLFTGMEVTVFDPDLDEDGSLADALADHLLAAFDAAR